MRPDIPQPLVFYEPRVLGVVELDEDVPMRTTAGRAYLLLSPHRLEPMLELLEGVFWKARILPVSDEEAPSPGMRASFILTSFFYGNNPRFRRSHRRNCRTPTMALRASSMASNSWLDIPHVIIL